MLKAGTRVATRRYLANLIVKCYRCKRVGSAEEHKGMGFAARLNGEGYGVSSIVRELRLRE
jgi:hypothetical protein